MKETHPKVSKATIAAASGSRSPGVSFSIRPIRKSDLGLLLAMIRELAAFEHLEKEVTATVDSLESALFGRARAASALLAQSGGEAIGYAIYYRTFSSFVGRSGLFLDDVYVRPAWRKLGVGRALLERTAQIGAESNCGRFEWIALKWNKRALDFYRNLGAARMNNWVLLRMNAANMASLAGVATPATRKHLTETEGTL